jgi:hypothetical protein
MTHIQMAGFWNRVVIAIDDAVQIERNNLGNRSQVSNMRSMVVVLEVVLTARSFVRFIVIFLKTCKREWRI